MYARHVVTAKEWGIIYLLRVTPRDQLSSSSPPISKTVMALRKARTTDAPLTSLASCHGLIIGSPTKRRCITSKAHTGDADLILADKDHEAIKLYLEIVGSKTVLELSRVDLRIAKSDFPRAGREVLVLHPKNTYTRTYHLLLSDFHATD